MNKIVNLVAMASVIIIVMATVLMPVISADKETVSVTGSNADFGEPYSELKAGNTFEKNSSSGEWTINGTPTEIPTIIIYSDTLYIRLVASTSDTTIRIYAPDSPVQVLTEVPSCQTSYDGSILSIAFNYDTTPKYTFPLTNAYYHDPTNTNPSFIGASDSNGFIAADNTPVLLSGSVRSSDSVDAFFSASGTLGDLTYKGANATLSIERDLGNVLLTDVTGTFVINGSTKEIVNENLIWIVPTEVSGVVVIEGESLPLVFAIVPIILIAVIASAAYSLRSRY